MVVLLAKRSLVSLAGTRVASDEREGEVSLLSAAPFGSFSLRTQRLAVE